jgi:hypothetical protein
MQCGSPFMLLVLQPLSKDAEKTAELMMIHDK